MRKWLIIVAGAAVIAAIVVALVAPPLNAPNIRETTFPHSIHLIGFLSDGPDSPASYYSIRVGDSSTVLSEALTLRLCVRNESFALSSLLPDDVQKLGCEFITPDSENEPERAKHAYLGWGTQNRDGLLAFYFRDGKLVEFYARWHLAEPSPFTFVSQNNERLTFPFKDGQLERTFGKPLKVDDFWIK